MSYDHIWCVQVQRAMHLQGLNAVDSNDTSILSSHYDLLSHSCWIYSGEKSLTLNSNRQLRRYSRTCKLQ